MSRSCPRSVYVMADGTQTKIGISDNPQARARSVGVGRSAPIRVIHVVARDAGDARSVERTAHKLLAEKRASGEWFDVSPDEAIEAVRQAISMVEAGDFRAPIPRHQYENVIGVRLEPDEKAALEKAAAADDRSVSAMVRKITVEWLRKHGHLKAPRK